MDPEGVREVFYAECGTAPDYGVPAALHSLPFHCRHHDSLFVGLHLPLTRPLPKRLDVTLQQYTGIHAHDAAILAAAGGEPVVVAGTSGRGRAVMVNAWPQPEPECMFRSPGWPDLLRQILAWLMNRPADLAVEHCHVDRSVMPPGARRVFALELAAEAGGLVQASAGAHRVDPGWLAGGRGPQFGALDVQPLDTDGGRVAFAFQPDAPGLWRVTIELHGEGWANVRNADVRVVSPLDLRLSTRTGEYVTAPERTGSRSAATTWSSSA